MLILKFKTREKNAYSYSHRKKLYFFFVPQERKLCTIFILQLCSSRSNRFENRTILRIIIFLLILKFKTRKKNAEKEAIFFFLFLTNAKLMFGKFNQTTTAILRRKSYNYIPRDRKSYDSYTILWIIIFLANIKISFV